MTKACRRGFVLLVLPLLLSFHGCASFFLNRAWPTVSGEIRGLPVKDPVQVIRDTHGIPHIIASSEHDLWVAQGFVHAQDRMWQMETMRRVTEGRLSEIAGQRLAGIDCFSRMLRLAQMKTLMEADLTEGEIAALQAYSDGVNAWLASRGRDLPVEFSSLGFVPEPWTPRDCLSFLPLISWEMVFGHFAEELVAVARGRAFTEEEWNDAFPSRPNAELPPEQFFGTVSKLAFGKINPAALCFHFGLSEKDSPDALQKRLFSLAIPGGGSNNWVVAKSDDGTPLLANDPHLGLSVPATWYFCHLSCPGLNVAGVSAAGTPGIIIGRNEHAAWGMTNTMIDAADIIAFTVDPEDPTLYSVDGRPLRMEKEEIVIGLPRGESVRFPVYRTIAGPVITAVERGVQAVAALRWYGTIPDGALHDHSVRSLFERMKARSVAEILDGGRDWAYVGMNLVAADDRGAIGWHVTGAVPLRDGYTGRLPGDGTAGARWTGFARYDELPRSVDPPEGWIATANSPPAAGSSEPVGAAQQGDATAQGGSEAGGAAPSLSYLWAAPYRRDRISAALSIMRSASVEDFQRLQMDVHSLQADKLIPKITAFQFADERARRAARLLSSWDREVTADSAAAALYEAFLTCLDRQLLGSRLGDDMPMYFNCRSYGVEEEIFDRPGSPLWGGDQHSAVEKALANSWDFCARRMGADDQQWSWQRIHAYTFVHPGAADPFSALLLNRGPYPAPGDCNTVNVAHYMPGRDSYDVMWIPSMRMIAAPGRGDGLWVSGPLGQSGQPGNPHYDDMTAAWLKGELLVVPLSRAGLEKVARDRLVLSP